MPKQTRKPSKRDVAKAYPVKKFTSKLRRLIDALESGEDFRIQIAGERITIPANAVISIEHERTKTEEEVEFQFTWKRV